LCIPVHDNLQEDEIGEACGTHETCDKWVYNFSPNISVEYEGVGGKTFVIDHEEVGCDDDWILLAQDRFEWRAVASPVFNLVIPRKSGDSLATATTFSFSKTVHMK
jgi:hypothetical protein